MAFRSSFRGHRRRTPPGLMDLGVFLGSLALLTTLAAVVTRLIPWS